MLIAEYKGSGLLKKAMQDALMKGAVEIETSTTSPDARRLYERHHFKQFKDEVFLELDMKEYNRSRKNAKKL